jgi:hypothetical protein
MVGTEAEDVLGICYQAMASVDIEVLMFAVMICRVYRSVKLLYLPVVMSYKCPINQITSLNPVSSH